MTSESMTLIEAFTNTLSKYVANQATQDLIAIVRGLSDRRHGLTFSLQPILTSERSTMYRVHAETTDGVARDLIGVTITRGDEYEARVELNRGLTECRNEVELTTTILKALVDEDGESFHGIETLLALTRRQA